MSNRIYNVLFNTHTISGIVISAALYVIFFAGSFSFFRDEIVSWERNAPVKEVGLNGTDFDRLLDTLSLREPVYGRDIEFRQYYEERRVNVSFTPSRDSLAPEEATTRKFFYMDREDFGAYDYASNYSIGEFLYRLHFFAQLNFYGTSGYLLAGLVAFFFLFAVITGVLVHWNKIVSNFYTFRPRAKLKTLWTDAHTTLGILGLPYQFIFALTGTYLMIGASVMAPPVVAFLYDNDAVQMYEDFGIGGNRYAMNMQKLQAPVSVNALVENVKKEWEHFDVKIVTLYNYGDTGMHVSVEGVPSNKMNFTGQGKMVFEASSGKVVYEKSPFGNTSYLDGATNVLKKLHFGDFGGLGLRIVYFILGIVSCFVIISGVMIWLVARDKKSVSGKKRRFNAWLVWIYLSICLSMYPATAFTFVAVKAFVHDFDPSRITWIYRIFFYSWLLLSLFFTLKKDNYFTNKYTLLSGSLIGLLVPVVNGVVSGNWMWVTLSAGDYGIFFIDTFWIVLSVTTLLIGLKLKQKRPSEPLRAVKRSPKAKKHVYAEEI